MKKISIWIVILLTTFLIMFMIDDELTDESKLLIKLTTTSSDSAAFVYALGIFSAGTEEPGEVGSSLLEEYQKVELDEHYLVNEYPESKQLPLPNGELFCNFREERCLKSLFSIDFDIDELYQKHQVLIQRLDTFYSFTEYSTLTQPILTERFPPLRYISAAMRLKLLSAIKMHRSGSSKQAMRILNAQLSQLRHVLARQDNLIGKIMFLMKLSEAVEVMSVIRQASKIEVDKIASLSVAEKTLSNAFAREFALHYNTFESLDDNPEFFNRGGNVPAWVLRLIYKPNMTINAIAPFFTRLNRVSGLSHLQFVTEMRSADSVDLSTSSIRNSAGNVLTSIAMPSFDHYISRFLDFDAKLVLFNSLDRGIETVANPYYKHELPIIYPNKICFNGPLEDDHLIRCLRTDVLE
ncbi:MAG: hypothetical protein OFPII_19330 [Osedax symbiont Rs1]|nr:MAG: hypothetical protein OFPII_19330 [Osedax symbiont Rs1]